MLTDEVYALCLRDPLSKDFGLRDQLQRAAVSVMNNIAEGWESIQLRNVRHTTLHAARVVKCVP